MDKFSIVGIQGRPNPNTRRVIQHLLKNYDGVFVTRSSKGMVYLKGQLEALMQDKAQKTDPFEIGLKGYEFSGLIAADSIDCLRYIKDKTGLVWYDFKPVHSANSQGEVTYSPEDHD
jgi:hypothetical protein